MQNTKGYTEFYIFYGKVESLNLSLIKLKYKSWSENHTEATCHVTFSLVTSSGFARVLSGYTHVGWRPFVMRGKSAMGSVCGYTGHLSDYLLCSGHSELALWHETHKTICVLTQFKRCAVFWRTKGVFVINLLNFCNSFSSSWEARMHDTVYILFMVLLA